MNIIKQPMLSNTIRFFHPTNDDRAEVMRITRDGVWVNPDMSVDDAAQAVLRALDSQIKVLVDAAVAAEREAIAQMFDDPPPMVPNIQNKRGGCLICGFTPAVAAKAIRARGNT